MNWLMPLAWLSVAYCSCLTVMYSRRTIRNIEARDRD